MIDHFIPMQAHTHICQAESTEGLQGFTPNTISAESFLHQAQYQVAPGTKSWASKMQLSFAPKRSVLYLHAALMVVKMLFIANKDRHELANKGHHVRDHKISPAGAMAVPERILSKSAFSAIIAVHLTAVSKVEASALQWLSGPAECKRHLQSCLHYAA